MAPTDLKMKAINHGKRYEGVAIERYEALSKVLTNECGLFVSIETPYLADSPDRLMMIILWWK